VHAVVGGFTPGNTSFVVMNPDFYFVLAMDVIVSTTGVGNVLRTSVCTSPTITEAEVLWYGLKFVMMLPLSLKLFTEHCEYVYRVHPINAQLVTDPVIIPAKEEHGCDSGSERLDKHE
jgi:hypothetical protein